MQLEIKKISRHKNHQLAMVVPAVGRASSADAPCRNNAAKFIEAMRLRLDAAREISRKAAMNPNAAAIHDARVGSRRAQEVIGILVAGDLVKRSDGRAMAASLRKLRRRAGVIRNIDVFLAEIAENAPPGGNRELAGLKSHFLARRAASVRAFIKSAKAVTVDKHIKRCDRLLASDGIARLIRGAQHGIALQTQRSAHRLRKRLERAINQSGMNAIHKARIAAKRLRYICELRDYAHLTNFRLPQKRLRQFQKIAGELHDATSAEQHLKNFANLRQTARGSHNILFNRLQRRYRTRIVHLSTSTLITARDLNESIRQWNPAWRDRTVCSRGY